MTYMDITSTSHPHLYEAFETISHDGGGGAGHASYSVPRVWTPYLDTVDKALSALTEEELSTFCTGEETDMGEIARRSHDLRLSSILLNSFFEDWMYSPPALSDQDAYYLSSILAILRGTQEHRVSLVSEGHDVYSLMDEVLADDIDWLENLLPEDTHLSSPNPRLTRITIFHNQLLMKTLQDALPDIMNTAVREHARSIVEMDLTEIQELMS